MRSQAPIQWGSSRVILRVLGNWTRKVHHHVRYRSYRRRSVEPSAVAEHVRPDHEHPDQARHRQAGQLRARQPDQLLHRPGPVEPRQRLEQPARTRCRPRINTIQAANNGITSITKLVQSAQALVSQAQQTSDATVRAGLATQFDCHQDPDRPARRRLGLQRHQPARQHEQHRPDRHVERKRHVERHDHRRRLHHRPALAHQQRHQQLGRCRRHHRGEHRPDRRADHAAFAGPGVRLAACRPCRSARTSPRR